MGFDGIVTTAISRELNKKLLGGRIEKIYQPESEDIIFYVQASRVKHHLFMSSNSSHPYTCLMENKLENPSNPLAFCMLLRKHLSGGTILGIEQKNDDRVIDFFIESQNELGYSTKKTLTIEIMGKHSNIVLYDQSSGIIIDAIKRVSFDMSRARQILPGKLYEPPPSQDKVSLVDLEQLNAEYYQNILSNPQRQAKQLLASIKGLSPILCENLAMQIQNSPQDGIEGIQRVLLDLREKVINGNWETSVYQKKDGTPVDFHVLPLEIYKDVYSSLPFPSVSQGIEYYYANKDSSNRLHQKTQDLEKAIQNYINKMQLKKQRLSEDLLKANDSEDLRLYGELLTAHLHEIKPGAATVNLENYYNQEIVTIPLDVRIAPSKNAQNYFKKYGKAKTSIKEKTLQLEEVERDLNYLTTVQNFLESAESIDIVEDIRTELIESGFLKRKKLPSSYKKKPSPFLEYILSDGTKAFVGRNNKENDQLTFQKSGARDYWFHTKDIPGSHVVLSINQDGLKDEHILEGAALAAYHSKARNSSKVPVDYMPIRYVKKPKGAKPGMVIFTNNKTVYVDPKELKLKDK
jgi:predicted ribosome quality control (RQC) complex YloA/Tae2 family protein